MRRPKKEIQLTSYDELLGLEESPEKSMGGIQCLSPAKKYKLYKSSINKSIHFVQSGLIPGARPPVLNCKRKMNKI